jgi:hypothetical protein
VSGDFERWENTPYPPDPPAIDEVAEEEARALRIAHVLNLVIFWVVAAAFCAGAVWIILRANR